MPKGKKSQLFCSLFVIVAMLSFAGCGNGGSGNGNGSNQSCTPACTNDSQCDDGDSNNIDLCSNPNTCSATCTHSACVPACNSDSDCDDGLSNTYDICENAGTCAAYCANQTCCSLTNTAHPLSPVDGIYLKSENPYLLWSEVSCARYFILQVQTGSGTPVLTSDKIRQSYYQYSGPALVNGTTYRWNVTAYNGCGDSTTNEYSTFTKVP